MSEYGLRIKNIEAATLYEYNLGIRDRYDYKDAMFVNSLFKDFLEANGLKHNGDSTRDIICLEFNFGTRTFEKELAHLKKIALEARLEYKLAKSSGVESHIERMYNKRQRLAALYIKAHKNKDLYNRVTKEEIRRKFYNEGVDVEYLTYKKNGEVKKREVIHYKMLYRSTGKAKKGSCMFIRSGLYKKAKDFLYMGIKLKKKNAPIVEVSAYIPLVSSGIVGRIKIDPKNILVLKDVDKFFKTNVISIETDENRICHGKYIEGYELCNTLFDGQALIDSSIFPDWGDGYILLRHHFCKMAAFSTNIQKFFKDYYGDNYSSATVTDMFGQEHYVKDIELITTDNAVKWSKFGISYDYWCDRVNENGCMFGIVKTAHESKLGSVQKMSYQMVNSLDEEIMESVMQNSIDYIMNLKNDDRAFLEYLNKNSNFANDYEVLVALCEQNMEFTRCDYYKIRKNKIIVDYVKNMKFGKLIQNADNLVIVGSPYAMLLHSVGEDVENDETFHVEPDTIQCYTGRFDDGEYLAEFRSPFNSANNLGYLHNTYHPYFEKYFNFGRQIIAVNMIGTCFQDRNNGLTYWPRSTAMC